MQIGINTWVWESPLSDGAVAMLVSKVAALGFDWIELPLESIGEFDYTRGAALIREHGLGVSTCAAMGPDRDLIDPDEAVRANGASYIRQAIDATHALGARNLVGPIYAAVGRTWQMSADERARDTAILVAQLRDLAAYAATRDVVVCIEPLNRFETSFINLAAQAIDLVDQVDRPNCQIMLDTFHMNIEERSLGDAIRAAGKRVAHVHTCENDRGAPGSGHVPWNEVAAALHDIGYNGPCVIESFTSKVKTIARAAAIWRSFAPTQDDLAKDGLTFLRRLFA